MTAGCVPDRCLSNETADSYRLNAARARKIDAVSQVAQDNRLMMNAESLEAEIDKVADALSRSVGRKQWVAAQRQMQRLEQLKEMALAPQGRPQKAN